MFTQLSTGVMRIIKDDFIIYEKLPLLILYLLSLGLRISSDTWDHSKADALF